MSERRELALAILMCFVIAIVASLVLTAATLAYDRHACHERGGHFKVTTSEWHCSWAVR